MSTGSGRCVLSCVASAAFALCPVLAQRQAPALSFDVASVKPNASGDSHAHVGHKGGTFEMTNVTLKSCITVAYGVADAQVAGPAWLESERYDIVAKSSSDAGDDRHTLRLRTLLADRFKLAVHRETRDASVYELVAARNGPKLKPDPSGEGDDSMSSQRGHLTARGVTMARLAGFRGSPRAALDHLVLDKTGIEGVFSFTLDWTPDDSPAASSPQGPPKRSEKWPSLLSALQEQLGLKLEARRAPVESIVIDHVEKIPTEN